MKTVQKSSVDIRFKENQVKAEGYVAYVAIVVIGAIIIYYIKQKFKRRKRK